MKKQEGVIKEEIPNEKTKLHKISDIVSIVLGIILLLITAFGITSKAVGKDFFVFGSRFDVVLTGSMSTLDDANKTYYEERGWNNRLQVDDLIISTKITADTEINEGDIVTYNNPAFGKVTHRIIKIYYRPDGEKLYRIRADSVDYDDGNFTRDQLISKVTNNAGQVGALVRFLQSFWGLMMFVSLGILCFIYSYVVDMPDKETRLANKEAKAKQKRRKESKKENK